MGLTAKKWIYVIPWSIFIYSLLALYLFARFNIFDFYIVNKAIGFTGTVLLGIVLLIGPLTRLFDRFDFALKYRKEIGIAGFVYAFIHGVISRFFLPSVFLPSRFTLTNIPFVLGLVSLLILSILFAYSFHAIIENMDRRIWWKIQYWGIRIAFFLAQLHYVLLKRESWLLWWVNNTGEESSISPLPPFSLLMCIFGLSILTIRIGERVFPQRGRKIVYISFGIVVFLQFILYFRHY